MCEELNKVIMTLTEKIKKSEQGGTIPLTDDMNTTLTTLRKVHADLIMASQKTLHMYATWCDSDLIGNEPYNPKLIMFGIYQMLSERYNVPLTWVSCIPMHLFISSKTVTINVEDKKPLFFTKNGYATERYYSAYIDAMNDNLIPEDSCFLFERTPEAINFNNEVNNMTDDMKDFLKHMNNTVDNMLSLDMSFPNLEEE
tara:strand:- start:31 stop:627 length:597 start_codon:yes stop_codon:yes gene_type:complete